MAQDWQVILTRAPQKELRRVSADMRRWLLAALHTLEDDPRPPGYEKLKGYDLYGLRVGDWHIVYRIEDARLTVLVVEIAPRGRAYRRLTE